MADDRALEAWAFAWDRLHPPLTQWEQYWYATGLGCGMQGLCGWIGHPVAASDLALAVFCGTIVTVAVALRARRMMTVAPGMFFLLWPCIIFSLLKLQPAAESLATALRAPFEEVLPELPYHVGKELDASVGCVNPRAAGSRSARRSPPPMYVSGAIEREWLQHNASVHEWHAAGQICKLATQREQVDRAQLWLEYSRIAASTRIEGRQRASIAGLKHRPPPVFTPLRPVQPTPAQHAQLSYFRSADGRIEPIEPLTGMGRHPLATPLCDYRGSGSVEDIFNLSYLIITNQSATRALTLTMIPLVVPLSTDIYCSMPPPHPFRCDAHGRPRAPPTHCAEPEPPRRKVFFDLGCTVYDDDKQQQLDVSRGSGR